MSQYFRPKLILIFTLAFVSFLFYQKIIIYTVGFCFTFLKLAKVFVFSFRKNFKFSYHVRVIEYFKFFFFHPSFMASFFHLESKRFALCNFFFQFSNLENDKKRKWSTKTSARYCRERVKTFEARKKFYKRKMIFDFVI